MLEMSGGVSKLGEKRATTGREMTLGIKVYTAGFVKNIPSRENVNLAEK
jgi:hypothetical protein